MKKYAYGLGILAFLFFLVSGYVKYFLTYDTKVIEVIEANQTKDESGFYRISICNVGKDLICQDNEIDTMINKDDFWFLKFNSATVQSQLQRKEKQLVEIEKSGIRFSIFSMFENIIKVNGNVKLPVANQ